jgi:CRP-like cAMP-binding protein
MSDNRLLLALPPDLLSRGEFVIRAGEPIEAAYFPIGSLLSLVVTLESGETIEATTVGMDGFAGVELYLGRPAAELSCIVQVPGEALRLDARAFRRRLADEHLRERLGGYTAAMLRAVAQSIACMAFHPVGRRLARWLLMVRDGTGRSEFPLTHDLLAVMLGVHRPTVTLAVRSLEENGLVEHSRGRIRLIDSAGLRRAACECYEPPVSLE